ncbi:MAG: siroheme synthase CysG [Pseudomonadota bacterium]
MDFFPIFLDLQGRSCLVVGGGEVATRKTRLLLKAGAKVVVVAPRLSPTLQELLASGLIEHEADAFDTDMLEQCALVIAATSDAQVNQQVHDAAVARNIPVNVVDQPRLCTFILPSIIDRSPVVAAVSTGGASPTLARLIRARLETMIPASYGRLAALAERFRERVKARFPSVHERRLFWESALQGPVAEQVFAGHDEAAGKLLEQMCDNGPSAVRGEVYLIGAGPGDPDLLTFRALRLMQQADVVLYDRLVSPQILDLVRRDAELIYVGKARSDHAMRQEEINQTLARLALEGKRVCRLKGGDPFIFGRGGEEIETLAEQGIHFQVVPGITAASGCAAYAGIPLTHRDYAQSVAFITGHLKDGQFNLNWDGLILPQQTLVIYMGLVGLDQLCAELIQRGMRADMPAALIQQGTTPEQRVYIGDVSSLPELVKRHEVKAPTLVIIGEVVRLHEKLAWYHPEQTVES